jgi:hypothetical protein
MKTKPICIRFPLPILEALKHLTLPGQPLHGICISKAIITFVTQQLSFPAGHVHTRKMSQLQVDQQDLLHDFVGYCVKKKDSPLHRVRKPPATQRLRRLAIEWQNNGGVAILLLACLSWW